MRLGSRRSSANSGVDAVGLQPYLRPRRRNISLSPAIPSAGPRRSKPRLRENGETTSDAVDRGPVSANNGGNGDLTGGFPARRAARSGDPGTVGADVPLAMDGTGAGQGTEPLGSCADSWIRMIIFHQSAHDCCNRPDDRTARADGF